MRKTHGFSCMVWLGMCCASLAGLHSGWAQPPPLAGDERTQLFQQLDAYYQSSTRCQEDTDNHLQRCLQNQGPLRDHTEATFLSHRWASQETLVWVVDWMTTKGHVEADELPSLESLSTLRQLVFFFQTRLPGTSIPVDGSALHTLVRKLMLAWGETRQSDPDLQRVQDALFQKYKGFLSSERSYFLRWAARMGDPRALNRITQAAYFFLNESSWVRWISYGKRQECQSAINALKEFIRHSIKTRP